MRIAVGLLLAMLICGCTWRTAPPTALDQAVRISVVADQGRSPRAGAYLQAAAAEQVAYRTGWRIRPDGEARIDLSIDRDIIGSAADDGRQISVRWRYTLEVSALVVTRHGTRTWRGSGTGYANDRANEASALQDAAKDAADALARWLAGIELAPPTTP